MTPQFAKAVDPIFEHVLALLDRIEDGEGHLIEPEAQKDRIQQLMDQAQTRLNDSEEWRLAKAALVYWIDEVLIVGPKWPGQDWWNNRCLEFEYYTERLRNHKFYLKARDAMQMAKRDALEVYYIAVILGFRGFYSDQEELRQRIAAQLELPPELALWLKRVAEAIKQSGRPPIKTTGKVGPGAPPLKGRSRLVASVLTTAVLAAVCGIMAYAHLVGL